MNESEPQGLPQQLEALDALHALGTLSDGELRAAKARLLGTAPTPSGGKPMWKRWWAIAAAAFLVLGIVGSLMPAKTAKVTTAGATGATTAPSPTVLALDTTTAPAVTTPPTSPPATEPPATAPRVSSPPRPAPTSAPQPVDDRAGETVSQRNARQSAAEYLQTAAFSRSGLIEQLKYEGYSEADATYGTDAQNADWFAEAAKAAQEYMQTQSFSRQALIDQLEYDGFTQPQAEHGADSVGL